MCNVCTLGNEVCYKHIDVLSMVSRIECNLFPTNMVKNVLKKTLSDCLDYYDVEHTKGAKKSELVKLLLKVISNQLLVSSNKAVSKLTPSQLMGPAHDDYILSENSDDIGGSSFWVEDSDGCRKASNEVPKEYHFSFNEGKFIYAFDIRQLKAMIDSGYEKNPYTQKDISKSVMANIDQRLRLIKKNGMSIEDNERKNTIETLTQRQKNTFRIIELYDKIEKKTGFILDSVSISNMSTTKLKYLYIDLYKKWTYEFSPKYKDPIERNMDGLFPYDCYYIKYLNFGDGDEAKEKTHSVIFDCIFTQIELITMKDISNDTNDYMAIWFVMSVIEDNIN